MHFQRMPGVRVELVGNAWAAFSSMSGETLLLNNEAAAVLEVLADGAVDPDIVCATLARDGDLSIEQVHAGMGDAWQQLLQAGLVRRLEAVG